MKGSITRELCIDNSNDSSINDKRRRIFFTGKKNLIAFNGNIHNNFSMTNISNGISIRILFWSEKETQLYYIPELGKQNSIAFNKQENIAYKVVYWE